MKRVKVVSQYTAVRTIEVLDDYAGDIETCDTANSMPSPMPANDGDLVSLILTVSDAVATTLQADGSVVVLWLEDVEALE